MELADKRVRAVFHMLPRYVSIILGNLNTTRVQRRSFPLSALCQIDKLRNDPEVVES